jgi:hypothetical protein
VLSHVLFNNQFVFSYHQRYVATIVGLTESTTYHFIVIPANSLGAGTPSLASQSASTLVSSLPGIAYFEEDLTVIGNDRVTVHWRLIDTGGITCTFDVELVDSVDWSNSQNGTDVSGNTVTFTGLIASRTYDLYITARNVKGYGARSDPITVVASSPTLPGELSTQVAIMNSTSESVFVEWNPVEFTGGRPITGYKLEVEEVAKGSRVQAMTKQNTSFSSTTFAEIYGLHGSREYRIYVLSINDIGITATDGKCDCI